MIVLCRKLLRVAPATPRIAGFSLIEVLLAVGITAILVTTVLGLLPSGLEDLRSSGQRMATARILEHVAHELQMRDFDSWAHAQTPLILSFDNAGDPLPGTGTEADVIYRAQVTLVQAPGTVGVTLPGAVVANVFARQARIRITDLPGADPFTGNARLWERTLTITRMEKLP